jgi:hypothetical protein
MTGSARTSFATELQFFGPPESPECDSALSSPNWLAEIREMRGCVFYAKGRRPFFRTAEGRFDDPDPIDLEAYHIIVRSQGRAVGCARVVNSPNVDSSVIWSTMGTKRFQEILRDIGTTRERTCEASRWVVVPECRGRLGARIAAASWTVARWLSVEIAFVLAGTRQKQDLALIRLGARPIAGLPLFASEVFDDDLRLLYFDVLHPSEWMGRQMLETAAALRLEDIDPPCVPVDQDGERAGTLVESL